MSNSTKIAKAIKRTSVEAGRDYERMIEVRATINREARKILGPGKPA